MAHDVNWGIIGTGGIALAMLTAVRQHGSDVVAVGSRSSSRASEFAESNDIVGVAGTVEELVAARPDVVYVGSSNHHHLSDALACIRAGIPVLCEKPLTPNGRDSRVMVAEARASGVFLMEAMWMRFQPAWGKLIELIDSGLIGPVRTITADFGIAANDDPNRRWFDPAQAGGSLLDVGIYPITFAYLIAGAPVEIESIRTDAASGVDAQFGVIMKHPGDAISVLASSIVSDTAITATVSGLEGRLHVPAPHHHPDRIEHWVKGDPKQTWDTSYDGSGYVFEVAEVERCLAGGLTESPVHPLSDTLAVMDILDTVRTQA